MNKSGWSQAFFRNKRISNRKIFALGILLVIFFSTMLVSNGVVINKQSSLLESKTSWNEDGLLKEVSENGIKQFKPDIDLKSFSTSSNHFYSEPITLFIDDYAGLPTSAGRISRVDFYDNTKPESPIYLGSSKWNKEDKRWELTVAFEQPGLKAITADIITTEGYTTQTTSLVQINDDNLGISGISENYYSAIFGSDLIWELGWEGVSGHFEDTKREEWLGIDAEIKVEVQLHEITKAYYESSTGKWYPTKESTVKLTAEANRIHGIIYHDSPGNAFNFQVSDLDVGDYVNLGRAAYRWFGDSNDDYVYMYNKQTTFSGSYCIGMKIDVDLDLSAWTDDGNSWSNGGNDYRLVYFGFAAQAADLTVIATALADNYFLQVYDRDSPTMDGPVVNDMYYYSGGLHVTNPEFLKYSVRFRADFTTMEGIPSYGTHQYRWKFDTGIWSSWTTTSNSYCYSPYFDKGSSGSAMVMVEVRDTYFYNTRDYGELFYWDYTGSFSNVIYGNLVKSSSSLLNDITSGTLLLSQNYADPTDYSGCGVDRTEDIWSYKDINNNWQVIGTGSGTISWNVNGLPDADPGYQLSYYTEDRLDNGRENTAIWIKTNNKVAQPYQGTTFFRDSYTVGDITYVHESTDWIVTAYDNVGVNERDDGIDSVYVRIWTDSPFPFSDVLHYEETLTGFTYIYTLDGHKVYTLTIEDIFDIPDLKYHNMECYLDFQLFDGLGGESTLWGMAGKLKMDYSAEHHDSIMTLSGVSPLYTDQGINYISGTTRLSTSGYDPDISTYEWFVDSTSVATTSTRFYDLDTETLVEGQSYNFKVQVKDIFGNTYMSSVTQQYTVDNTIPDVEITSLADSALLKGTISLEWTTGFTDIEDAYWQYRYWDGVSWSDWNVITDSDSDYNNLLLWDTTALPEYTTYEIRITAVDRVSLTGTDVVGQITIDNVDPTILEFPDNLIYELGTIENELVFNISDVSPFVYSVYRDSIFQYNGSWTNNNLIEVNIDGLDIGTYNYYLAIYDDLGNSVVTNPILVTVEDTTVPIITQPDDVNYVFGSIDNIIGWTATDLRPWSYSIYINNTHQFDQAWVSGDLITVNIDGLDVGVYSYRIEFYDQFGNMAYDEVIVTVEEDGTPPVVLEQDNLAYEFGTSGNELVWSADDFNPSTYNLYIDGTLFDSGAWSSETIIEVNLDGLDLGLYLYRIEFYDLFGNMAYDEVNVTVVDTTMPEIIGPLNTLYEEGTTGNNLLWTATDLKPEEYYLYINGSLDNHGLWVSSQQLVFSIDGLEPGVYNYTIVFFDTSRNSVTDEVLVTVTAITTDSTPSFGYIVIFAAIGLVIFMKKICHAVILNLRKISLKHN